MKINLLRDDQVTKIPHQKKEKDVLRFDDTFSGGNDDFYFQQPVPPTEEYKKPRRKFRFWLFLIIFIICGLGTMFIVNPQFTADIFRNFGKNVATVWNKSVDKIETFWLHRKDNKVVYVEKPIEQPVQKVQKSEQVVKKTVDDVQASAMKRELPDEDLTRMRAELEQGLKVAHEIEQQMEQLEGELKGLRVILPEPS